MSSGWCVECSWENPLSIEAKSPRPTAHTRHHKTRNKSQIGTTSKTSAPIAERFSAWALFTKFFVLQRMSAVLLEAKLSTTTWVLNEVCESIKLGLTG
jgi:hypothetical protein